MRIFIYRVSSLNLSLSHLLLELTPERRIGTSLLPCEYRFITVPHFAHMAIREYSELLDSFLALSSASDKQWTS